MIKNKACSTVDEPVITKATAGARSAEINMTFEAKKNYRCCIKHFNTLCYMKHSWEQDLIFESILELKNMYQTNEIIYFSKLDWNFLKKSCNQTWNDITRICFREKMQNSFSRAKVLQMVCCWWSTAVQANQLGCSQWVENQNKWGDKITR